MEKNKRLMKAVYILICISSFSLLLSLVADSSAFDSDYEGGIFGKISAYAVGTLFWGCMIAGYVVFCVINAHRKKESDGENIKKRLGLISFFSNKYAQIFDIAMAASFVLILICGLVLKMDNGVLVLFISMFIFSFHMHCILNGVNYAYINSADDGGNKDSGSDENRKKSEDKNSKEKNSKNKNSKEKKIEKESGSHGSKN